MSLNSDKKANVSININNSVKKKWTEAEKEYFINKSGCKDSEIANYLGRTITSVRHKRRELGINKKYKHKYNIDLDFFKTWNYDMAYILGYFFADANIRVRKSHYELRIKSIDKNLLDLVNKKLKSNYPINLERTPNKTPIYRTSISRKEIILDLLKLGLIPKKSLTMHFPSVPK